MATQARAAGIEFTKQGNCFTRVADPAGLAQIADTLSQSATAGRLSQVCDRWIYSALLCFGLDLDEQARSGFRYGYSVFQVEYTPQPNLRLSLSPSRAARSGLKMGPGRPPTSLVLDP